MGQYRVGYGCDIHRFVPDRELWLCACRIPCAIGGLLGHSDADACIHALIDAYLGALALGDIGHFFPDTDPEWKGASGELLLRKTLANPAFNGWQLVNLDMTVITQEPKLAPHISAMRERLASLLNADVSCISVKAKTNEGLDAVGRKEALEARCVIMLTRTES